jgi:hypothetical protein
LVFAMRLSPATRLALVLIAAGLAACATSSPNAVSAQERQAIIDSLTRRVKAAYDLSKPDVAARMLSLYPDSGRVVSASGGQMLTSRDSVAIGIKAFWTNVGSNMRDPHWIWDRMVFDVLSPTAAVMTATYRIPHLTPRNQPHVIGGAWTAVFQKRGSRWYIVQEHLSDLPPAMPDSVRPAMPGMKMPP